jgi:hypothetical protein
LQEAGIEDVLNIPAGLLTNDHHIKVWQSTCTIQPIISPMRAFAESLIETIEIDSPIIVYGTFESTVLKTLIEFCPDFDVRINYIIDRLVNFLPWIRNYYYHPAMKGLWLFKAVWLHF